MTRLSNGLQHSIDREHGRLSMQLTAAAHESLNAMAVQLLAEARTHAERVGCDPWQFALEIVEFTRQGIGHTDLRLLIAQGLAEHRLEVTTPQCRERRFERLANYSLPHGTCFVLTDAGLPRHAQNSINGEQRQIAAQLASPPVPCWDRHHRVLTLDGQVVKAFRVPAANQEAILWAFEAAGWPPCIADPLSNDTDHDPRQRLTYAIKALNRSQQSAQLRFFGDGTGRRVCWRHGASP